MSQLQVSKPTDPLASLRIDRGRQRQSSGGIGKLVLIVLLLGIVAAGGWAWLQYGEQFMRPQVKVASVEVRAPGVADSVLSAQGYLKSRTQAAIGAKVAGRVSNIFVEEGDPVEPLGDLAELEHGDMKALLEAMQASVKAMDASIAAMQSSIEKSEAELREAKTTLDQDDRDLARTDQLFRNRGTSAAEMERAKSKYQASSDRYKSLEAGLALAKARKTESEARKLEADAHVKETNEQIENFKVRAPPKPKGERPSFMWTVISKEAEVGESITPGGMGTASGRGSVVTLANLLNLEVETDVKEDYVGRVHVGQQVNVAVDGVPDRRFTGSVRTIIPMGDRAKGTIKVKVQLKPDEVEEVNVPTAKKFTLFPEMAATVHFLSEGKEAQSGKVEPQVYAPAAAVKSDGDGKFVWQLVEDRVKRTAIETGDTKDNRVFVQRGLKGGEKVVIDPPVKLQENMLVKVLP